MVKEVYRKLRAIKNARKHKYISDFEAMKLWLKNRDKKYRLMDLETTVREVKKSDTLFILGSGPSLNTLTTEQLEEIKKHDSFGISLSFLQEKIAPTFHLFSYETDGSWEYVRRVFQDHQQRFSKTVFILLEKAYHRHIHPRIMPDFFPPNPVCFFYPAPDESIIVRPGQELTDDLIEEGKYIYRGSMSLVIHMAIRMGYKKIVMVGVDLHTPHHFFDHMPVMQGYIDKYYRRKYEDSKYESMNTRQSKGLPFDAFLEKLGSFLARKRGITLYTSRPSDYMAEKLPTYF